MPPVGADDHVRGTGPEAILYLDLACPGCASAWPELRELGLRICVRHFPLARQRPRSPALHAATEAAFRCGGEAAFWSLWDSLYADRGRVDDPHLWERAERLGLELEEFEAERRDPAVEARVQRDFRSGVRAGVAGTPTAFVGGRRLDGDPLPGLRRLARS